MRTRGDVACVTKRHHVLGHTWQDFWYGVVQSVVSFAITGAIAFIAVRRLKLSERAMQVRPKDAVTVGVVHLADLRHSALASTLFKQTDAVSSNGDAEKFVAALKGMRLMSPRGPIMIDPETRDIVQTVYIRRVERVDGLLYNIEFDKYPDVKDPGKQS